MELIWDDFRERNIQSSQRAATLQKEPLMSKWYIFPKRQKTASLKSITMRMQAYKSSYVYIYRYNEARNCFRGSWYQPHLLLCQHFGERIHVPCMFFWDIYDQQCVPVAILLSTAIVFSSLWSQYSVLTWNSSFKLVCSPRFVRRASPFCKVKS